MKNYRNKRPLLVPVFFAIIVFAFSCKENEGDKVTFGLDPVEVSFISENIVDSANTSDTLLIDTLYISNDFYRNALDANDVYLDDVQSVSIITCSLDITDPAGFDINDYKSVSVILKQPGYADELLIAESQPASAGSTFYFDLKNKDALLPYFKLLNLPVYVLVYRNDASVPASTLKLRMQFEVTGIDH